MKQSVRCDSIKNFSRDPKQMLIAELNRQDREEASRIDIIAGRPVDQRIGASDQYILLDTSQRDRSRSDHSKGIFAFNIVSGGTTGSSMIGVVNQLNDIIEVEMQSFPFPNIPEYVLPTNPISTNSLPLLIPNGPAPTNLNQLFNNRFIIQIEETSVQSYSDTNGVRHNFAYDLLWVNNQLYASPVAPVYVFTDPITRFDTLTLIFRNPPVNLEFGEDTMVGSRLAILQNIILTKATPVSIVMHNKLSDYIGYIYNSIAGTIDITVTDGDTVFTNPNAVANTFQYKDGSFITNMTISTRFVIDNAEGDGANEANGVYILTSLVDNGGTHTYVFTRTTDLNQVIELVQYVSVNVMEGMYKGKIYFLNSNIGTLTEDQNWVDFSITYLLSLYYSENKLIVGDRLKITDIKRGTIPQNLHNYLTRPEGLYVGTISTVVPPENTSPIDDIRNYFRLNPDVSMGEFIYNSFTNNYTIKNISEAKLYGFNTLKPGQIIIVPGSITKGISQLAETITYDKVVDTTIYSAYVYSNWTITPTGTLYGQSTLQNNVEYKTFTDKYNTAVVLDKMINNHDLRYFEIEYTGIEDELTDLYIGIVKPFDSSTIITPLISDTWTNNIGISTNEGFLTQFDFVGGNGTSLEDASSVLLTAITSLSNSKLDTGGYIQLAIEMSTNDIIYEIVIVRKDGTVIGDYHGSMTTVSGPDWITEKTKRLYITTNNTEHTFKSTSSPHTYAGSQINPINGFVNIGDSDYEVYISDFTDIVPGKKFNVVGRTITNVTNFIIALTGQELASLNRLYQLETMDDIKSTGIRLTENNLIMPLASPTIYVPSRVMKIPMRFRRILRKITQMSGI